MLALKITIKCCKRLLKCCKMRIEDQSPKNMAFKRGHYRENLSGQVEKPLKIQPDIFH